MTAVRGILGAAVLLFGVSAWTTPSDLRAQAGGAGGSRAAPDTLAVVDTLASLGRTEEARALLAIWMAGRNGIPPEIAVRARWLQARLTLDPWRAETEYRAIADDDPTGRFAPLALLRLGLFALARGELDTAEGYFDRIVRDHPLSAVRLEAQAGLRALAAAHAGDAGPEGARTAGAPPGATHAVQVGVYAEIASAAELVSTLREKGVVARLVRVRGSELIRVRAGYFTDAEAAGALLRRLAELGYAGALVANVEEEVPIG